MASILIAVTGGVAAYKAAQLVRLATAAGHGVRVLMTPTAERFIGAATFEAITGAPVLFDEFQQDPLRGVYPGQRPPDHEPISHLAVAENADVLTVAPASANTIAKLAAGICDSMVTTSFLAAECARIVAPAMNDRMWRAEATRSNVATLRERGVVVLEPGVGALASRGEHGAGRMPEPDEIMAAIEEAIGEGGEGGDMRGLRVLVTAGGTREPIDSVRFIGNRSSGRMGFALAERAARRGAQVTLIAANVSLPTPSGVERVDVGDVAGLAERARQQSASADVVLMAAAVSDFRPAEIPDGKIAREEEIVLRLTPTEDVLASLTKQRQPGQTIVGFAAEHGGGFLERARAKLDRKGVDAIVVNDVSDPGIGFDSAENEVTFVATSGERPVPRASKAEVADRILDLVLELRSR